MMVGVYILYSAALDQYYVGLSRHPQRRLQQHQRGSSAWTSRAREWVMVYLIQVGSMTEARTLEKQINTRGARRFIETQLPNPAEAGQG